MQFTEFLDRYQIPYRQSGHHHCRQGWIQLDCPWCGRNTAKWHLGYNLAHGYLNCWRCGPHQLVRTMVELTGIWPSRIKQELSGLEKTKADLVVEHTGVYKPPGNLDYLSNRHRNYLDRRGFDPDEMIRLWDLRSLGLSSRGLSWRLFIPFRFLGREVSWTTRTTSHNASKRYISARPEEEAIPHKQILYGWDYVRTACIVVEGPTDVWRVGPGAVATLGLGFTAQQIELLSRVPRRVICFDNEPVAQRRARNLRDQLLIFEGETVLVQLDSSDPGDADEYEIKELRRMLK